MTDRPSQRITAPLTEEGRRRYAETRGRIDEIRRQVEADRPDLVEAARAARAAHDAAAAQVRDAVERLRAEREARGLSLDDLEARSGLPAAELARVEAGPAAAVSLATLQRYAAALGKGLSIVLTDPA